MVATIQQLIGKINPKLYAVNGKELLKKYGSSENIPADEIKPKGDSTYNLIYDSPSETLEPLYFFILDVMGTTGLSTEKLVDNFSSSPGSGHFSEMGQRASIMQQQGTKMLGDVNTVLRSVLNIIYDLRDLKMRLQYYDDLKEKGNESGALLSLKQLWMDKVDMAKGNSSIKAMALGQAGYQTLIDAFLVVNSMDDIHKLDLNDRVKRMIIPRWQEFNIWVKGSEIELRKRYGLEKHYLKSQVNSLKLYSRWAKPYLRAAQQLEAKDMGREPALVKAFNTVILELTLLGKSPINVKKLAIQGELPKDFEKLKTRRDYFGCVLVDFKFRGIPQKVGQQQHYAFGGLVEVNFHSYGLNKQELDKLNEEIDKSDVEDVLKLIEGSTSESLSHMQEEIDYFLNELENPEGEKRNKSNDQSNPFAALFGFYDRKAKTKKSSSSEKINKSEDSKPKKVEVLSDNYIEANHIRTYAQENSKATAFLIYDLYKKAHGMVSYT
mgnify:CR=1 FL=1